MNVDPGYPLQSFDDGLSVANAQQQFRQVIALMKQHTKLLMKTKEGRNLLRVELAGLFGQSPEQVEIEGYPPGLE